MKYTPRHNQEASHQDAHVVENLEDHEKEVDNADFLVALTSTKEVMNVALWEL